MRTGVNKAIAGFSMMELLVTMAIMGLLAAIAIPSYNSYVRTANRTDAINALMQDAQALQRCYSQNFTYTPTGGCGAFTAAATTTSAGFYSLTVNPLAATTYTIVATPVKVPQTNDTKCASFTLLSTGARSSKDASGVDSTATCWGSN